MNSMSCSSIWRGQPLQEQEALRRALHNTIQELKGNIRVFCRVRPGAADVPHGIECTADAKLSLAHNSDSHAFGFDKVFSPAASQDDIFAEACHHRSNR